MPSATPGRQPQTVPGTTLSASTPNPSADDSQSSENGASPADEAVDTEILQKEMIARNSLALEAQVEERPLAKLQEELQEAANDQLESERPASSTSSQSENTSKPSETPGEKPHHRKALLKNDDVELQRIKRVSRVSLELVKYEDTFSFWTRPINGSSKPTTTGRPIKGERPSS
jgi:RNA polymerase II subunit A C-terminal domain phosphatase